MGNAFQTSFRTKLEKAKRTQNKTLSEKDSLPTGTTQSDAPQAWPGTRDPHLDLSFAHDLVHNLIVVLVDLGLVIALLIAKDPQGLRALQLNLKFLEKDRTKGLELLMPRYTAFQQVWTSDCKAGVTRCGRAPSLAGVPTGLQITDAAQV